jgi:hypothetical protein
MAISYFLIGVLAVQAVSPPPTITPVPPMVRPTPPPIITTSVSPPPMYIGGYNRPNAIVRVRIFAGRTRLLEDSFRVGRTHAMFNQNRSDAVEKPCATTHSQTVRTSLSFGLRPEGSTDNAYRVSFGWTRPTGGCAAEGILTVNLDQAVMLDPGQTVTVEGDGGVRIELSRL